jgi:adenine-specific DNA-methyltransferase
MTNEKLTRFTNLLRGIFELDKADLDFGIYRIMNLRKDKIEQFLTTDLPLKVQDALAPFASDTTAITARIAEIEKQAADLGIEIIASPKLADEYAKLKSKLAAGVDLSSLETDVYSALYSFFNRYYDEGDFISKRRYKEGVYAIPYEGEEVKLYWANADQYYIKTAENFRDYTFIDDGKKIHFKLIDATTEKNNNKESDKTKRVFMLYTETSDKPELKTIEEVDGELIIRFVFDITADAKAKYSELNLAAISKAISTDYKDWYHLLAPATQGKKDSVTIIGKHLQAYVAKNTFDYFIHKDLHGFLSRELDFFIKSEVIHLDDIDGADEKRADSYLAKVRAIKRVGKIIIEFLAQIEDFQKKLWLKKKFVTKTDWCITLDRISENFYPEIIANSAQIAEWKEMYAIDEIAEDLTAVGYSEPLTVNFLRQNGNLILDTSHFSADFKDRLIASIDNLDEQTGGLMIHSENFQALQFLTEKYRGQIKCVYIDPPYNAQSSEILYKNTYKNSSWLSLMYDRLVCGKKLLKRNFCHITAIDEIEQELLGQIISGVFEGNRKVCLSIVHNPRGQQGKNISFTHEFAYLVYPSDEEKYIANVKRAEVDSRSLRDSGTESDRTDAATCFYPFFVKDGKIIGIGDVSDDDFHPISGNILNDDGTIVIYPIDENGNEKKWRYSVSSVEKILDKLEVKKGRSSLQIIFNQDTGVMRSLWTGAKYDASEYGTKVLQDILSEKDTLKFSYPKSINTVQELSSVGSDNNSTILDYFAGSGTTGHAVINLNREDKEKGNRKYILVEMGEYFNTVTLPRIKKVIYSDDWKSGKPQNRNTGVSHIMKYLSLESYEDTLSNIALEDDGLGSLLGDEYLIKYMFEREANNSMLNLDAFSNPFAYALKINENNETKEKMIDVSETFNYLLGLSVIRQSAVAHFSASIDEKGEYENAVNLSRDDNGEFAFKQIEGKLPDGKRVLVIWRTITKDLLKSNAALDAYFSKYCINPADREFDVIYVNGDNNLENLRTDDENRKVNRIEPIFKEKMFEEAE